MDTLTILGRGKAGRALAAALAERALLLPHDAAAPDDAAVLLAVPDHAIAALAALYPGRVAHMSGSLDVPGVPCAHPLTSFDGQPRDWRGTPLAITGTLPAVISAAFLDLGFVSFDLPPEKKALYHAACVLSSGHAATL